MEGAVARVRRIGINAGKVDQVIVLGEAGNPVAQGAGLCIECMVEDEHVTTVTAFQHVKTSTADERVVAGLTNQLVVTAATNEPVVTMATGQLVIAGKAEQLVIAAAAIRVVVAVAAGEAIIAVATVECVVPDTTEQTVIAAAADEGISAIAAYQTVYVGIAPKCPSGDMGSRMNQLAAVAACSRWIAYDSLEGIDSFREVPHVDCREPPPLQP